MGRVMTEDSILVNRNTTPSKGQADCQVMLAIPAKSGITMGTKLSQISLERDAKRAA
jgi:hypothetical protein